MVTSTSQETSEVEYPVSKVLKSNQPKVGSSLIFRLQLHKPCFRVPGYNSDSTCSLAECIMLQISKYIQIKILLDI